MSKINFRVDSKKNFDKANTSLGKGEPALSSSFPYELRIATSGNTEWSKAISLKPVVEYSPSSSSDDFSEGSITYDENNLYIKTKNGWHRVSLTEVASTADISPNSLKSNISSARVSSYGTEPSTGDEKIAYASNSLRPERDDSRYLSMEEFRTFNYCSEAPEFASGVSTQANGLAVIAVPFISTSGNTTTKYLEYNVANLDRNDDFILQTCTGYGTINGDFQYFGVSNYATYPSGTTTLIRVPTSGLPSVGGVIGTRVVYASDSGVIAASDVDPSLDFKPHPFTDLMAAGDNTGKLGIYHGGSFPISTIYPESGSPTSWVNIEPNYYDGKLPWTHIDNDNDLFLEFVDPTYSEDSNFQVYKKLNTIPTPDNETPNFFPLAKMKVGELLPDISQLECGMNDQFYALTDDGKLYGWGYLNGLIPGPNGGISVDSNIPITAEFLAVGPCRIILGNPERTISKVCAGDGWAIALTSDGEVFWWGQMNFGGNPMSTDTPQIVPTLNPIVDISLYDYTAFLCDSTGGLFTIGSARSTGRFNFSGEGSWWIINPTVPTQVFFPFLEEGQIIDEVSVGLNHALIRSGRTLWGYGDIRRNRALSGLGTQLTNTHSLITTNLMDSPSRAFAAGNDVTVYIDGNGRGNSAHVYGRMFSDLNPESTGPNVISRHLDGALVYTQKVFVSKNTNPSRNTVAAVSHYTSNNTNTHDFSINQYDLGFTRIIGANNGFYSYTTGSFQDYIQKNNYEYSVDGQIAGDVDNLFINNHPKAAVFDKEITLGYIEHGETAFIKSFDIAWFKNLKQVIAMNENNFLSTGKSFRYRHKPANVDGPADAGTSLVNFENPLPITIYSKDDYFSGADSRFAPIAYINNWQIAQSVICPNELFQWGLVEPEGGRPF